MSRLFSSIGCCVLAACSASFISPPASPVDFVRWAKIGDADWQITDDGIEAVPGDAAGFLVSPGRYANFVMTLEYWVDDETNSGVFVRCADAAVMSPSNCYEINIWDNHPNQDFRTGSIVGRQSPLAHVDTLGQWNRVQVDAYGDLMTVTVNGVVTARLRDPNLYEGHIALQYAGKNRLRFRDVWILVD